MSFRIAYVINSLEGGGAALPVPSIANVMRRGGAAVRIFALTRRDGRALAAMTAAGHPVSVRDGAETDHWQAYRWLERAVGDWGATHLWTSLTRATLIGQQVGRRRGLPVVSWQHAAYLKPANRHLLRATQQLSRLWIGDSRLVTELTAARLHVPPARLACWPIFRADPSAARADPGHAMPLRIGSLGRLHPVKGYDVLIAALARLPRDAYTLTIGGDGRERDALMRQAHDAGVPFAPPAFVADPRAFLAGLDLYVQPSRSEGLCVAAHEAMQAGLPVIASAVGEMPYSIATGETGWIVPPDDPAALAHALSAALSDPGRLRAMGSAGRDLLLARFGAERFDATGLAIVERVRRFATSA